ncbi:pseudouridine synthase [Gramella sp. AN32]|uniref:Pseudouridine synthase n=1 Tax=Christiangramia antarctica TaxID=2058158 RepID=A0ABW5X512_9FLAO|nr:pseudouridine synthase [Gramella sp. AN32]MCM4157074.1 ribulose phosphate epimerase [Gramella sp. AN32]
MYRHFKLYKPYGYLSQFITNEKPRKNKLLLGDLGDFPENIMAIGRLDKDSEGLLFLTTNGKASQMISAGDSEKEYYVQLDGEINAEAIEKLENGIEITHKSKKYLSNPCKVQKLEVAPDFPERPRRIRDSRHGHTSWISITLTEGKFRQVKKMTAAVGFPTLRLVRVRIANEYLGTMQPGEVIELEKFSL